MIRKILLFSLGTLVMCSCVQKETDHKTVICIPVYGQSLALGEEAERTTDFDSLAIYADGRIVTENLDHSYGYFDNSGIKQLAKKLTHYQKRSFELSVYAMAKELASHTGRDTLISIFPGGRGATALSNLSKGTEPYKKFIEDIETAYKETVSRGWDFLIPAICWMQGESDIVDYPETDYQQLLTTIWGDMNDDIRQMTHQKDTISFICYQANSLTRAERFKANSYTCRETAVPQAFVNLLRDNKWFWASGPTYPYPCVGEKIHIDASGQQAIGYLAAHSALGILRGTVRHRGLIPLQITAHENVVVVDFDVPTPPLALDTIKVSKARHYGFSVINKENKDITTFVTIQDNAVSITCSEPPQGCRIRYAVNGDYMKSGNQHGPRGNLRDDANNWCYQFDICCP